MSKLTRIFAMLIVAICGLIFFYVSAGDGDSANPPAAATSAPAQVDESPDEGLLGAVKDAAKSVTATPDEATSDYIAGLMKDFTTQLETKATELEGLKSKTSRSPNPEMLNILGRADAVVEDIEARIAGLKRISDVEAKARKLGIDIQLSDLSNMLDEVIRMLIERIPSGMSSGG